MQNTFKKKTRNHLLLSLAVLSFASSVNAEVVINDQQVTPSYFLNNSMTNAQLLKDSLATIDADENTYIIETEHPSVSQSGANSQEVTVVGMTSGVQQHKTIKYTVVANDYEQNTTPEYVINSKITGTDFLEQAGIHIYSPSTVTLEGKSLSSLIPTGSNTSFGVTSLDLNVDGEHVADVQYNLQVGSNLIVTPGTNMPVYSLNQSVDAEDLVANSGTIVNTNEDFIFLGEIDTSILGNHKATLKVITLTTASSEDITLGYMVK
ncbi:hypothetical protein [Shewanella violacea]|uniref:Uncharacterized protein n=1 Tax=Shewanella violacea (strain JCM 10179 / CIP 106290 / LMG 19151 / DSS12) TaxID=637905 RepID=D4ZLR0_SHEVD|nr:hypothetical protein [Shewanella violacea]BAJ02609.1 hypothetical protein SVI_2638 [Shewanella violacea DSS12]